MGAAHSGRRATEGSLRVPQKKSTSSKAGADMTCPPQPIVTPHFASNCCHKASPGAQWIGGSPAENKTPWKCPAKRDLICLTNGIFATSGHSTRNCKKREKTEINPENNAWVTCGRYFSLYAARYCRLRPGSGFSYRGAKVFFKSGATPKVAPLFFIDTAQAGPCVAYLDRSFRPVAIVIRGKSSSQWRREGFLGARPFQAMFRPLLFCRI